MVKRKRIALNYRVGYDFSAGIVIYIQNIIKSLKLLDDHLRPHLIIIYSKASPIEEIKEIDYPYIEFYLYKPIYRNFFKLAINKLSKLLLKTYTIKRYSFPKKIDILYPYFECEETFFYRDRLYWKPDFQEQYFPQYVSTKEIEFVNSEMKKIAANSNYTLVLSSQNAMDDYKTFFSPTFNKTKLLKFISLTPDISKISAESVLQKYNITKRYFLVANQFWPHKNHMVILEAMKELYESSSDFQIVMTGKKSTYRDKKYLINMEKFILENGLQKNVKMTSFISREEQLVLMYNSIAVIQPSLFEGWSTVIEDCKNLGHFVLASDLSVNIEQISKNCLFFEKSNPKDLASKMKLVLEDKITKSKIDYHVNIESFKKDLVNVFELDT